MLLLTAVPPLPWSLLSGPRTRLELAGHLEAAGLLGLTIRQSPLRQVDRVDPRVLAAGRLEGAE